MTDGYDICTMMTQLQTLTYPFTLPELPYNYSALEPVIDARTMEIHHSKHHAAYINKLNTTLESHPDLHSKTLAELLFDIEHLPTEIRQTVINHGGGHANHSLFWATMSQPKENNQQTGELAHEITHVFGTFDAFKETFTQAALNQFGSGWAWLSLDEDGTNLHVGSTPNQNSPLIEKHIPLLGLDVWEHAYYLNYQNKRADYIEAWWSVINWEKVSEFFASSFKG